MSLFIYNGVMPTFAYRAYQPNGREIRGSIDAPNEHSALERLERKGLMPFEVLTREAAKGPSEGAISAKLLPLVTRQLATVLSSGTQLAVALDVLAEQPVPPRTRVVLQAIAGHIRGGSTFSEALSRFPKVFSPFYVQMVRVGESTGGLDTALEKIADHLEKVAATRGKVVSAMTYPLAVLGIGLLMTFALVRFVVPQFASVLQSLGGDLPAATQLLLDVSTFAQENTLILLLPGALTLLVRHLVLRSKGGREWLGEVSLQVPVLGDLMHKGEMAMLASTLATAVNAGSPLVVSLDLSIGSCRNAFIKRQLMAARAEVERGQSLKDSFKAGGKAFSALFVSMVGIGEESGNLSGMLEKVTLFYDREVEAASANLVSLLQPVMICVLGVLIGGIAYSLFAPIFSLVAQGPNAF